MLSHHHKVLFVHIPKCGGQSVELAFLHDLGLDWERRVPLLLHLNEQPQIGPKRLAHLTARQYIDAKYMTEAQRDAYYKFTTVRDPYGRAVSLYNYLRDTMTPTRGQFAYRLRRKLLGQKMGFDTFWDDIVAPSFEPGPHQEFGTQAYYDGVFWFMRPQVDYVYDAETLLVDDIFRLEELSARWSEIAARTKVGGDLPHHNRSTTVFKKSDLSERHCREIRRVYAADFERLGYPV